MNQDFVAWVGQGTIADRTKEHLGESDRGVIMLRRRMLEEAAVVAAGGDPKAVIRDPDKNHALYLPRVGRGGRPSAGATPAPFVFHAGQPREIVEEMRRIWAERGGTNRP
jgi:5,5'-dehydrodivanillate O-demethylase